jgi:hypothetical protein
MFSSVSLLSHLIYVNHSPFICVFLYSIVTLLLLSLSSLDTSLNFFFLFLSSFVIYVILSPFLSLNLLLFSIMFFFFCSQLSIFASIILSHESHIQICKKLWSRRESPVLEEKRVLNCSLVNEFV